MSSTTKKTLKVLKGTSHIWHEESGLVFKSKDEKLVIGRFVDGTIISLDDIALELCEKWVFKYDPDLISSEKEEEEEEDEGEDVNEGSDGGVEDEQSEENQDSSEKETTDINDVSENNNDDDNNIYLSKFRTLNNMITELSSTIDSQNKNYIQKINSLKSQLNQGTADFQKLKQQYEHTNEEYLKLKTKFDGIKNLFS
jgi:hypothetical protein